MRKPVTKEQFRRYDLKKLYGITPEEYTAMAISQGGVCAICGRKNEAIYKDGRRVKELCVDHDHNTRRIRGLLCNRCNRFLGTIDDSILLLQAMIHYLQKYA